MVFVLDYFNYKIKKKTSAKVEGVHKEFQKAVRAGVCRFIPETGNLMMISTDEASQKKARMIQEMHFRNLSQKVSSKFRQRIG